MESNLVGEENSSEVYSVVGFFFFFNFRGVREGLLMKSVKKTA